MKRVDILKLQLKQSRGRFFTIEFRPTIDQPSRKLNMKIKEINADGVGGMIFTAYVKNDGYRTFAVSNNGDCTYVAADKSQISMKGWVS